MNIKNSRVFHALVNKRLAIICLLIFCVGTLWTTGILSQVGEVIEYTAKGVLKLFTLMNDAASAYYNISATVENLTETLDDLEEAERIARARYGEYAGSFLTAEAVYQAERTEFWSANSDYNAAENRRIIAQGDINMARDRIAYCQQRFDGSTSSEMADYWREQLAIARDQLSDATSRKSQAVRDKARANSRFKRAQANLPILRNERDRWKTLADTAKQEHEDAKQAVRDRKIEIALAEVEAVEAKKKHNAAIAAYEAYQAMYDAQQDGGGGN